MPFLRRRWPWLLVILFPLLPLWRAVFLGDSIGPFDQIRQMAPWNGPPPDRPFDVLQADAVLQFYPWRDMVFDAWGKGQLPLWNPYQLAGTPLLANSQSAGFYPPHILMGVLHVPTPWAITLLAWFHLAWAGLGVMFFSRRLGASPEGAAIGGLLFSGSAFMLAWTALPSVISTCAWIPWVLGGVYVLFEKVEGRRSKDEESKSNDERRTTNDAATAMGGESAIRNPPSAIRSAALLAFSTGMMLLAGHLQFAFYGLLAAGFVLVARLVGEVFDKSDKSYRSNKSYRSLGLGLIALALGAGLAAPQLLPVLEYSKFSHRRNLPTEEGYRAYVAGAIAPFELVGLIYPTAVGLPFEFAPDAKPLSQYWPALVKQGANFAEGAIGIGPLALFGLLMFPWRRASKKQWVPIALLAGLAFLLALGTNLNKPLYFLIPGWSSTGSPGRIGVLFVMGACTLTSVAITALKDRQFSKSWKDLIGDLGVVVAAVLTLTLVRALVPSFHPRFEGMSSELMTAMSKAAFQTLAVPLAALIVVGTFIWFSFKKRRPEDFGLPPMVFSFLFAGVYGLLFAIGLIPTSQPLDPNPLHQDSREQISGTRAAFINDPWELIVAAPATLPPNTASIIRQHDLAGYDSLLHKDTQLYLAHVNGQDSAPPANGNIQFIKPTADPKKLADAGVRYVYSRKPVWTNLTAEEAPGGLLRYDLHGSRVSWDSKEPGAAAIIHEDGYDHQSIMVTCPPGLMSGPPGAGSLKVTVKDRLMPGWKAFVDGNETPWLNEHAWKSPDGREVQLWREVEVKGSGGHHVEFRYDPPGLKTGLMVFLPCLLVSAGMWAAGAKRAVEVREPAPATE